MNTKQITCGNCNGNGFEPLFTDNGHGLCIKGTTTCSNCDGKGYKEFAEFSIDEATEILKHCGLVNPTKNRKAVTCNGRSAFYACMWDDIRQCAMKCGWAVALHGSLSSDMDIMAMPWIEEAITFEELTKKISELFSNNFISENYVITYDEKPHNRIVATIPIFADFYLDISTIRI